MSLSIHNHWKRLRFWFSIDLQAKSNDKHVVPTISNECLNPSPYFRLLPTLPFSIHKMFNRETQPPVVLSSSQIFISSLNTLLARLNIAHILSLNGLNASKSDGCRWSIKLFDTSLRLTGFCQVIFFDNKLSDKFKNPKNDIHYKRKLIVLEIWPRRLSYTVMYSAEY